MDILDILNKIGFNFPVFIFNVINFLILAYLLKKMLFDKIQSILKERREIINKGIEDARLAQEKLDGANEQSIQIIDSAKLERDSILAQANQEASDLASQIKQSASEQATSMIAKAKEAVKSEKESIISDVKKKLSKDITEEIKNKIVK